MIVAHVSTAITALAWIGLGACALLAAYSIHFALRPADVQPAAELAPFSSWFPEDDLGDEPFDFPAAVARPSSSPRGLDVVPAANTERRHAPVSAEGLRASGRPPVASLYLSSQRSVVPRPSGAEAGRPLGGPAAGSPSEASRRHGTAAATAEAFFPLLSTETP